MPTSSTLSLPKPAILIPKCRREAVLGPESYGVLRPSQVAEPRGFDSRRLHFDWVLPPSRLRVTLALMPTAKPRRAAIYVRVSTTKRINQSDQYRQNLDVQEAVLRKIADARDLTIHKVYSDRSSGARTEKRPGYLQLWQDARRGEFNVLLVYAFDRFSRSIEELVRAATELRELGIDLVCYNNQIDTSTITGKLVYNVLAAVAEFERDIIRERVITGMEYARAHGTKSGKEFGRPKRIFRRDEALSLKAQGHSIREIAKRLNQSPTTIQRACTESLSKKAS